MVAKGCLEMLDVSLIDLKRTFADSGDNFFHDFCSSFVDLICFAYEKLKVVDGNSEKNREERFSFLTRNRENVQVAASYVCIFHGADVSFEGIERSDFERKFSEDTEKSDLERKGNV